MPISIRQPANANPSTKASLGQAVDDSAPLYTANTAGDQAGIAAPVDLPSAWDSAGQTIAADAPPGADAWLAAGQGGSGAAGPDAGNWLDAPVSVVSALPDTGWHIHQIWDGSLPVQSWINQGLDWFVLNFRPFFQTVRVPIDGTLSWVEASLQAVPTLLMVSIFGLLAWQFAGRLVAVSAVLSLLFVAMLGIWPEAMVTLSLVLTSLVFCLLLGLPLGIVLARSNRAERLMRPLLDAMQTTPAFVYLVPVVMLFGIGNVPGVIVTIVFALAPLVRLTSLGIRQVRPDLIEAARAYGASPLQMLIRLQLPLAMPSIMAGINQSLMLSLSMVVIASMIAVGGLGQMVLRGIGRLDMGLATVGGLGIVLLAISLDRITQAMGKPRRGARHWWQTAPASLFVRMFYLLAHVNRKPAGESLAKIALQTVHKTHSVI